MSADAKVWFDEGAKNGGAWEGAHDGPCATPNDHHGLCFHLSEVLRDIELCMGSAHGLRWEFRTYPDGTIYLAGYV